MGPYSTRAIANPDQLGKGRPVTGKTTLHPIILAESSFFWRYSYIYRSMVRSSWAHTLTRTSARPDKLKKGRQLTGKPTLNVMNLAETSACWSNSYISRTIVSSSWAHAQARASARPDQLWKGRHLTGKPTLHPIILAESSACWSLFYFSTSMVNSSWAHT